MENDAPYASTAIELHLSSTSGMKYRQLHCFECGRKFIERDGDALYRVNDVSQPSRMTIVYTVMAARCGECMQMYNLYMSPDVTYAPDSVAFYLQPESVYVKSEVNKKLRFLHCMECGKTFHEISDRVQQVIDNRIPMEQLDPDKPGPMQAICSWNRCSQTWAIMI